MKRELMILVARTTSLVLIAFLVPLGYLVREVTGDRAINAATREAESLAPVVATAERDVLRLTVDHVARDDSQNYPLTVYLPDGTVLGSPAPRSDGVDLAARGSSLIVDTGRGREVLVAVAGVEGGTAVVRSFVSDKALYEGVGQVWAALGGLAVALLGLSLLVADRLARTMVRPLRELAEVSNRLAAGELDARVVPSGPNEVREIGGALNHLATRIGELLAAERESVADLSHRLRTPLTAMRLDAEALRDPEEADRLSRDVDALVRTVDEVIREARRPVREGIEVGCDVVRVVRDRLAFWSPLAEEEAREVTAQIEAGPLPVRLGAQSLSSALDALLGNVFAHTPAGTPFSVQLESGQNATAVLTVADHGPGFTTHDPSRRGSSTSDSTGLGLDIARRTAEATGGHLVIAASGPGAVVTLVLR